MKRSELNRYIAEANAFFTQNHFVLPPFAQWTPADWERQGAEANVLRIQRLGWDITDFASGDFPKTGLTVFTLRNGLSADGKPAKVYAEKVMFVRQGQITPFHYHEKKMEDIINRGGKGAGSLIVQLHNSTKDGGLAETPVFVSCDGVRRRIEAGRTLTLGPGQSVTLPPFLYHMFYAVDGDALIGEVSSLNDDDTDNFFLDKLPRYPAVVEDEAPTRLLCTEYHLAPSSAYTARHV
ncbi:MAG: D-lyxose/D-mannose family sugar isomerase [Acidobacteriaceae bacterium]